jgi:hypothetical protein
LANARRMTQPKSLQTIGHHVEKTMGHHVASSFYIYLSRQVLFDRLPSFFLAPYLKTISAFLEQSSTCESNKY